MPAAASRQEWKPQKGMSRQTRAVISESSKYWLQKFREQEGIERKGALFEGKSPERAGWWLECPS